jgi:hypothetical protein
MLRFQNSSPSAFPKVFRFPRHGRQKNNILAKNRHTLAQILAEHNRIAVDVESEGSRSSLVQDSRYATVLFYTKDT